MKKQKSFIAAIVALNILVSATAMPFMAKASTNYSSVEETVNVALAEKNFYYFNLAFEKIMQLPEGHERDVLLAKLDTITSIVWTKDVAEIVQNFVVLVNEKSGRVYDTTEAKINKSSLKEIDKQYLLYELTSWGKDTVWTDDYIKAVDSIIKVWYDKTKDDSEAAKTAINELKLSVNQEYLTELLDEAKAAVGLVPMEINAEVPAFVAGEEADFTVSTVGNDDAGTFVRVFFTLPEGAHVKYQEQDGNFYTLTDVYGPETGFPLGDVTSNFKASFDDAESYTIKVEFKKLDGTVIASKDITATVNEAVVPMEINAEVPAFTAGEEADFTVSTVGNDDAGTLVRAFFTLPEGAHVKYQEQDGNFYTLTDVYGPETGFPLGDVTSNFKASFDEVGSYTVRVEFKKLDGTVVANKDIQVNVEEVIAE